jgi:hypothetical protein
MIDRELVNSHLSPLNIQIWLEMIKISQLDHISKLEVWPWHWSSIMVSLRNNGHAECLIKLLDQGTLESMVVNMLNLTAGRSYSAGEHNLHFSNRWHEFCSTCKFWHFTCNRWHEFWSTCKFWHQNRWHEYLNLFPIPTQASPKEWPPLLRYASTYRSRFLILKIRKKILTKCIRRSCLSEKEVMRLGLRRCDQALWDSRYLGHYPSIWRFKKNHVRIFFCDFFSQVNDVRSWHLQSSECQCFLGWWWMCRVRCLHEGHKVC